MSLFNFFRRNKISSNAANNKQILNADTQTVNQELFVDNENPEFVEDREIPHNSIQKYQSLEFEKAGYRDGYEYPETDFLEIKLNKIKADFRNDIDKCVDMKRSEVGELKIHIIKTEGISTRLQAQLMEKVKLLEANISELTTQKVLSIDNEGIISSVIHSYRLGFRKGVERYGQEKLVGSSTGLFNL